MDPSASHSKSTVGVVLEGGGFRGMYTSGVIDVWMEHGITATATVGVSAGATFGCNFKSEQIGRALRYNKKYCADPRYCSIRNWLFKGDLFSRDFAYDELPWRLDVFDQEAFARNPMRFTVVATDINEGVPVYHDLGPGDKGDIEWIRASASIPMVSHPVKLEGRELLDGGVADSIPFAWMLEQGLDRTVVVLTQPAGYRKEPNSLMPVLRLWLKRYPRLVELLANRHERYNAQLDELARLERAGKVFIIRPSESVRMPMMVRDPEILERAYQVGRADAEATLGTLEAYISGD
ncbi:patatin-like phospholipase family protein [Collinsella tanakaei]|uniref:patatin-like phospholipase family protein n=1 Tax=Collinsella tanakaei TaxID=626935 RepID=UPI00195D2861|nr:patatin family protein [Collinsella tanakaei]MBM6867831.1 patatin family protein [Collinsella tanakaei]